MLRKILVLTAAALMLSAPALAQRGGGHGLGGGGGGHHDGGGNHGPDGGGHGPSGGGGSWGGGGGHGSGGGSWNGGGNWGGNDHHDWDRGRSYSYRGHDNFFLGLTLGGLFDPYPYGSYRTYSYSQPYWNSWGLAPYECRWDREFGYWRGRPADLEVRRCADAYGNIYIVQDGQRLWRYR